MLDWLATETGWHSGRYTIEIARPAGWELRVNGRVHARFGQASAARSAAARIERLRLRRSRLTGRLVAISLLAGLIGLVSAARMESNPTRGEAEALAADFEASYAAIQAGAPLAAVPDTIEAALVEIPYGAPVIMLAGETGGRCYAMYWNDGRGPIARWLVAGLECTPTAAMATSAHNVYHAQTPAVSGHLPMSTQAFDFDDILPPTQRQRPWTLPALFVLGGALLFTAVDASKVLLGVAPRSTLRTRPLPAPLS
jgi:hypothetical protein